MMILFCILIAICLMLLGCVVALIGAIKRDIEVSKRLDEMYGREI